MHSFHEGYERKRPSVAKIIGFSILGIVAFLAFAAIAGLAVMLLWNWLMPLVFGLPALTFWQALGITALAQILLGIFRGHRGHPRGSSWAPARAGGCHWNRGRTSGGEKVEGEE